MVYKRTSSNRIISVLLAFVLIVSIVSIQPTYAASKPAKVKGLTVSSRTYSSITVKWKKASKAKKYQIGYKVSGGTWKYKTVKSKYKSKKITGLKEYSKYSVRVRAINGKKKGKWSTSVSTYTCPNTYNWPELLVVNNLNMVDVGPGSVTLSWDVVEPAEERINNAENAVTEAQKKYDEINNLLKQEESEESVAEESIEETEIEEIVEAEPTNEESIEEGTVEPTLEEQLAAAETGLQNAINKLEAEKELATIYDKCIFRIYRSTDNENWKLATDNIANTKRTCVCRKCDAGVNYYFKVVACDKVTYQSFAHNGTFSNVVSGKSTGIPGLTIKSTPTTNNYAYKENRTYKVKGLMVHSVGASIQSAQTWVNSYNRKGYDKAAVHAFVDGTSGKVFQCLPWTMRAGHAGGIANDNYVGVEMCESKYIKYTSGTKFTVSNSTEAKKSAQITYESTVKLFAYLCDYFGIDPTGTFSTKKDNGDVVTVHTIMSHNEWRKCGHSGHWDPEHYWKGLNTGYTMNKFRKAVAEVLAENL